MTATVNPIDNPEAYDEVFIGQTRLPGVARPFDPKRKNEWDIKKGRGTFGSTQTFVSRPPCQWPIEFLLWEPEHWDEWKAVLPLLKYDPTKKNVQAVDIYHPSLAEIDVNSVVTESIGAIKHEGLQLYSRTIEFMEYYPAPPRSAVSTPTQAQSTQAGTTPGTPPDPVADQDQKDLAAAMQKASAP